MDSLWLKTQFQLYPEKTRADLARALTLNPPAVSKILAGNRQIKANEYIAMRRFFGLPIDGLRATGRVYRLQALPQRPSEPEEPEEQDAWIMPARLLESKTQAPPEKIRIFTVRDNNMEPDFMVGSQVLIDLSNVMPSPPGAFVMSDGIGHVLRQCDVVPGETPLQISVSSRSGVSFRVPLERANIIGRVIARLEWLI